MPVSSGEIRQHAKDLAADARPAAAPVVYLLNDEAQRLRRIGDHRQRQPQRRYPVGLVAVIVAHAVTRKRGSVRRRPTSRVHPLSEGVLGRQRAAGPVVCGRPVAAAQMCADLARHHRLAAYRLFRIQSASIR